MAGKVANADNDKPASKAVKLARERENWPGKASPHEHPDWQMIMKAKASQPRNTISGKNSKITTYQNDQFRTVGRLFE